MNGKQAKKLRRLAKAQDADKKYVIDTKSKLSGHDKEGEPIRVLKSSFSLMGPMKEYKDEKKKFKATPKDKRSIKIEI